MQILDVQHPFFRPLWRRIAVVVFCLGWGAVELRSNEPFWAVLFGALGVYCAWQFFFVFRQKTDKAKGPDQ
jgi:hypothetical protein